MIPVALLTIAIIAFICGCLSCDGVAFQLRAADWLHPRRLAAFICDRLGGEFSVPPFTMDHLRRTCLLPSLGHLSRRMQGSFFPASSYLRRYRTSIHRLSFPIVSIGLHQIFPYFRKFFLHYIYLHRLVQYRYLPIAN